jgi:hypothetical protein
MRAAAVSIGVALVLAAGCHISELTMLGPARPARDPQCAVTVIPVGRPSFSYADVASARAHCTLTSGRADCIAELRRRACGVGADVVYGFDESVSGDDTYIAAILAYRDAAPGAPDGGAPPVEACAPICSPGFACRGTTCVPQCNPACESGEVCNRHRTCEAAAVPADAAAH